jgi:predicted dehydrogenase
VLSEKPLAATLPEAVEMLAAAEAAERLLMVSQNRRYLPSSSPSGTPSPAWAACPS